jgi:hypothetical protein
MTFRQRAGLTIITIGHPVIATLAKWVIGQQGCTPELLREVVRRGQMHIADMPASAARARLAREGLQLQDSLEKLADKEEGPERI